MLPEMDGFAVARSLRERGVSTPILMLTARHATKDVVKGLDSAVDDYLTKPFAFEELFALGIGVFYGASAGLRKAADQELTSGIDGIETFLHHKLAIHEMNNLGEELREHSALPPRGKMFRVTDSSGSVVYQPDAMAVFDPSWTSRDS
jgi:DNA-binding response OmpR family regulator